MIELAKITGKVDGRKLQVRLKTGESFYAPVITLGTDVTLPSDTWINENKDKFLALVDYEDGLFISPIIVGFLPTDKADSSKYNTLERLLKVVTDLMEQLLKAKVNTQIGPQPFMVDTINVFNQLKTELQDIKKLIK